MSRGATLRAAQQHLGLMAVQVWVGYVSVGGDAPLAEDWLVGDVEPSARDHDLMAQSLNDRFSDPRLDHPVPYGETLAS